MKPKRPPQDDRSRSLYRPELLQIVDPNHPLVKLAGEVNWDRLDEVFGQTFSAEAGRPGISTRLMVSLHYLKYTYNLSDDDVVWGWTENPYWQYLSGMKWFEHALPIHPTSMTRWRQRIGEAGAEELLKETLETGLKLKALKRYQLKRINVDTTVQEKNIRFPTDGRLYDRSRERLVQAAQDRRIPLRQNYNRVSKQELLKHSRYAHARQMNRAKGCTKTLKNYLGRVIRDIERKYPEPDAKLESLLETSRRIHLQARHDKNKVYSVHEPATECISKGKAHKKYEFGCKVSLAATSRGAWIVGAKALHGNPYDGHTLQEAMDQVSRVAGTPEQAYVDGGYQGHDYDGPVRVHVDRRRRGRIPKSTWKWMKRRAAIEPVIGHLKQEHRMGRNRLKGIEGDRVNAILSAAGLNFSKLVNHAGAFLRLILRALLFHPRTHTPALSLNR